MKLSLPPFGHSTARRVYLAHAYLSRGSSQTNRWGKETHVTHVIGLFNDKSSGPQVVDALINSGFPRSSILRLEGSADDIEQALLQAGIGAEEANTYANDLPNGGAFVLVRVAGANVERAVKVMNRYTRQR